jgi:hypothetical protein
MNAQDLYEEIKAFLKYVGLSFNDMNKIEVSIADSNTIMLKYDKVRVLLDF